MLRAQLAHRLRVEDAAAGEHLEHHQAEGVKIGARRGGETIELLGRHVRRRAGELRVARARRGGQPEVGDPRAAAAVDHDVGWLQIAMHEAAVVRRREARADVARQRQRLVGREASDAPEQRGEVFAIDVLHGDEVIAVDFNHVVQATDVRVRDLPADAHLVVERVEAARVADRNVFERDALAELQVIGAVDLPRPSAADQRNDPVAARDDQAGGESRFRNARRLLCRAEDFRRVIRRYNPHPLVLTEENQCAK